MPRLLQQAVDAARSPRFWLRQLRGLVTGLLFATVFLYFTQRSVIYRPTQLSPEQFTAAVQKAFGPQTRVLKPFQAIVVEPPAGQPVLATAILFHGNAGLGGGRGVFGPVFAKRGLRLVLAEYPGYGPRPGEPSEQSLVQDARVLYAEVVRQFPGAPVMLVGESLGTGVAALLAADPGPAGPPARLVLLTPFRSLSETAARTLWMLPARYLVKDPFDVEGALKRYQGPLSVLVAGADEVVGAEQGRWLVEQARQRQGASLAYVDIPGTGHNTWRFDIKPAQWSQLLGHEVLSGTP